MDGIMIEKDRCFNGWMDGWMGWMDAMDAMDKSASLW
jgi:hypothetical protein